MTTSKIETFQARVAAAAQTSESQPSPIVGAEYRCTDPDFDGTVTVTDVTGGRVFYKGDADGDATLTEFHKCYVLTDAEELGIASDTKEQSVLVPISKLREWSNDLALHGVGDIEAAQEIALYADQSHQELEAAVAQTEEMAINVRTNPDPMTIAYLTIGAYDALMKSRADQRSNGFDSELDFIQAAIEHARFVDSVADWFDKNQGHQGVFVYDVVEQFGRDVGNVMIENCDTVSDPVPLMRETLKAAGYDAAKIEEAIRHASDQTSVEDSSELVNWKEVAKDFYGAICSLETQVEQMKGMFPDDDNTIQDALDDASDAHDLYDKHFRPAKENVSTPQPPRMRS